MHAFIHLGNTIAIRIIKVLSGISIKGEVIFKMDKNNKKPDHVKKSNKKNIKHDPSAESARAKFSPKNEEKDLS